MNLENKFWNREQFWKIPNKFGSTNILWKHEHFMKSGIFSAFWKFWTICVTGTNFELENIFFQNRKFYENTNKIWIFWISFGKKRRKRKKTKKIRNIFRNCEQNFVNVNTISEICTIFDKKNIFENSEPYLNFSKSLQRKSKRKQNKTKKTRKKKVRIRLKKKQ